jgi:hypothetical protein
MGKISRWFPPFCGVLVAALIVAVNILLGEGEDAKDKSPAELVRHYDDNFAREIAAVICILFAAVFILYFGGWLRRLLRDAEGPDGVLSAVAFAGMIVFAAGAAVIGSIHFALTDLADDIDPVAVQALNAIDNDSFLFFPVGLGTMVLATGISAVRHGALPRWLAWTSVVLGVLFTFPATFWFVFFIGPLWFLVVGIHGIRLAVREEPAPATA